MEILVGDRIQSANWRWLIALVAYQFQPSFTIEIRRLTSIIPSCHRVLFIFHMNFLNNRLAYYRVYKKTEIWAIFSYFFDPKFFSKILKMIHIGVILCGKSIARIPEA